MSIVQSLKNQLRSVIEWEGFDSSAVLWQWTINGDEIKNASKLLVKPGQGCFFLHEGKVEAILTDSGTYTLKTANIPFWTTVSKFMQAFESEHKVGIYFFRSGPLVDQKWGTTNPIKYFDAKYEQSVMLKAFGTYTVQVLEPKSFLEFVASAPSFSGEQLRSALFSRLEQSIKDSIAECQFGFDEIDSKLNEISAKTRDHLNNDVANLGFKITDFRINGTTFDEQTTKNIQEISRAAAEAMAAKKRGLTYAQQAQIDTMKIAAANEGGGLAATGAQLAAGVGMGQMMAGAMAANLAASTPPQAVQTQVSQSPHDANEPVKRLKKLKDLFDAGLIDAQEFESKKKEILADI